MTANTSTRHTQHVTGGRTSNRRALLRTDGRTRHQRSTQAIPTARAVGAPPAFEPRVISYLADYFPQPYGEAA